MNVYRLSFDKHGTPRGAVISLKPGKWMEHLFSSNNKPKKYRLQFIWGNLMSKPVSAKMKINKIVMNSSRAVDKNDFPIFVRDINRPNSRVFEERLIHFNIYVGTEGKGKGKRKTPEIPITSELTIAPELAGTLTNMVTTASQIAN